jgi:Cu+-exporting ATPase
MYRVARDMSNGMMLEDIESTMLVAGRKGRALVVLHADMDMLLESQPRRLLSDFMEKEHVELGVSCSNGEVSPSEISKIVKQGDVVLGDVQEVFCRVKTRCPNIFYLACGLIVDVVEQSVTYVVSTGGRLYPESKDTLQALHQRGAGLYIASGDSMKNLNRLSRCIGVPIDGVFDIASTFDKERIVKDLKKQYDKVIMVGDGMNDMLALRSADVGILTVQQGDSRPPRLQESADVVVGNISEVVRFADESISS